MTMDGFLYNRTTEDYKFKTHLAKDTVTTPVPDKERKKMLSVTPQLQRVWNYCAPTPSV